MKARELKELKKSYKQAVLFAVQDRMSQIEATLRAELADQWDLFVRDVNAFVQNVKELAGEAEAAAQTKLSVSDEEVVSPFLTRARTFDCGAQKYVTERFASARKGRLQSEEISQKAASANRSNVAQRPNVSSVECERLGISPLPRAWERSFFDREGNLVGDDRFAAAMNGYCCASLWSEGDNRTNELRRREKLAHECADSAQDFDSAMSIAHAWLMSVRPVVARAVKRATDSEAEEIELAACGKIAWRHVMHARNKRARNVQSVETRANHAVKIQGVAKRVEKDADVLTDIGLPPETKPLKQGWRLRTLSSHPNDVTALVPENGIGWTVLLDESYMGKEADFETGGAGIMAGLIYRDDNPLPDVPQLHCATDADPELLDAADKVLEKVLNHPNCGVLAIPARAYAASFGWDELLSSWVDVLIRLLPFPEGEEPVSIAFRVEPRETEVSSEKWLDEIRLACEKSLKASFPERAKRLRLSFSPLYKTRDGELSKNFYPDLVGHTCLRRSTDPTAKQRFLLSGWSGVCFIDVAPKALARLLRCFYHQEALDAQTWSAAVAQGKCGLVGALASRFGERAQKRLSEWEQYLAYFDAHLKSGEIDMKVLVAQKNWLSHYCPAELPDRDELVWLTGRMACDNHEGKYSVTQRTADRKRLDELCTALYEEFPELVCDSTLNLAVAYTNCYEFEMALALLQALLSKDTAVVRLDGRGKLLSSAGQHFAFLGEGDEAIKCFNEALSLFARLSDERERSKNLGITRAYLATATMDAHPEDARRVLTLYLFGDERDDAARWTAKIKELAGGIKDKFAHHILLRYLATLPETDPLRTAYLTERPNWHAPSVGHPWEMIAFYRAQLLSDRTERMPHYELAYRIATAAQGETLEVIAAVIAGAALADGLEGDWSARLESALSHIANISGLREHGRYQTLVDQPKARLPALSLAAKVLPFNFR